MHAKHKVFEEIKERSDYMLKQLSEGDYTSSDIYTNNLLHLIHNFCEFKPLMNDPVFTEWLQINHPVALVEVAMTGRIVMAMQNFFMIPKKGFI